MMLTDLRTLIAPIVANRCYPNTAPDNPTKPYITYQRISATPDNTLSGTGQLQNTRLQIDVWAASFADSQAKAALVKAAMLGFAIKNTRQMEQDTYESDTQTHRVMLDYSIWHL